MENYLIRESMYSFVSHMGSGSLRPRTVLFDMITFNKWTRHDHIKCLTYLLIENVNKDPL